MPTPHHTPTRVDKFGERIYPEFVADSKDKEDDDYYMVGGVRLPVSSEIPYGSARCVYYTKQALGQQFCHLSAPELKNLRRL